MDAFKYNCGDRAKDRITGLSGIIVGRAQHLYGCNRYWIQPEDHKDGKILDGGWFDEHALVLQEAGVHKPYVAEATTEAAEPRARAGGFDLPSSTASAKGR